MGYNLIGNFTRASKMVFVKNLEAYQAASFYKPFCLSSTSTGASEKYEWLGSFPGVSEWLDERDIHLLKKHDYTITNKKWEVTVGFTEDELNDNPAVVKERLPLIAQSAAEHPTERFFEILVANGACYDGQAFFDNSHPYLLHDKESTYDNNLAQTGTSAANIKTDLDLVRAAWLSFKKRNGHPLFPTLGKITILHGPAMLGAMETAFKTLTVSGDTNRYFGMADPIPCGFLSGNAWVAFMNDVSAMKPFIFQSRKKINTAWDDGRKFQNGKLYFGADARYEIGYGFPQLAITVGTLASA